MADPLGEEDLFCDDDVADDFRTVSGRDALVQALYRRWTTDRGTLIGDPLYGTNLTDYINEDVSPREFAQIVSLACDEAKKDERVLSIKGSATLDPDGTLQLLFELLDGAGPFSLALAVTDVTVQILTVE